jgi:hypothetical protein
MNVSVDGVIDAILWLAIAFLAVQAWRLRRRRVTPGPAAGATMHEILNDDRRKAIEIVLEERAAYHDPEDADGNLPDLERRSRRPPIRGESGAKSKGDF